MIGRERERERERIQCEERKRGKNELSKAEKRDAEYSIFKWPQSRSSRLKNKKDFIKIKLPL